MFLDVTMKLTVAMLFKERESANSDPSCEQKTFAIGYYRISRNIGEVLNLEVKA